MALIVVGGQAKDVGKTTLICNVIRQFPDLRWLAIKFSPHHHLSDDCTLLAKDSRWSIWEQLPASHDSDTARFLTAGAARALLVLHQEDSICQVCSRLKQELATDEHAIVESSQSDSALKPDLSLLIVDSANEDFKVSATKQLATADALIARGTTTAKITRVGTERRIPIFKSFVDRLDPALALFLHERLATGAS
jgi:hypothetical protein